MMYLPFEAYVKIVGKRNSHFFESSRFRSPFQSAKLFRPNELFAPLYAKKLLLLIYQDRFPCNFLFNDRLNESATSIIIQKAFIKTAPIFKPASNLGFEVFDLKNKK